MHRIQELCTSLLITMVNNKYMAKANLFLRIGPVGHGQVLYSRVWLGLVRSGMVLFINKLSLWIGEVVCGRVQLGSVGSGKVRFGYFYE